MEIALLGGTGDIGEGLALRWAYHTNHDVVVGSRDPERARGKAAAYETELESRGVEVEIRGEGNAAAAAGADAVVCAVPAYHLTDTVESVADGLDDAVLVSPAVGMKRDEDGLHYNRPGAGSVTALAAGAAPDGVPVVGAFHNLAADRLANLDVDLDAPPVDRRDLGHDADRLGQRCRLPILDLHLGGHVVRDGVLALLDRVVRGGPDPVAVGQRRQRSPAEHAGRPGQVFLALVLGDEPVGVLARIGLQLQSLRVRGAAPKARVLVVEHVLDRGLVLARDRRHRVGPTRRGA